MSIDVGQFATPVFFTAASGSTAGITTAASGSSFLVYVSTDLNATVSSIQDSKSNSYSQVGTTLTNFLGFGVNACVYLCTNGTGGSGHTATANLSASADGEIYFVEILNGATASIVDALSSAFWNDDSATPFTSNNVVTANATDLLLAFTITGSSSGTETLTWGNSFTQVVADGSALRFTGGIAKRLVTSTGTYTSSFTAAGAGTTEAATAVIALKDGSGGGGIITRMSSVTYRPTYF